MSPPVRSITSRDNPLLVRLRKLAAEPAAYRKQGEFWLEGEHLCSAFAERGVPAALALVGASAWDRPGVRALACAAAQVVVVPEGVMASSGDSPFCRSSTRAKSTSRIAFFFTMPISRITPIIAISENGSPAPLGFVVPWSGDASLRPAVASVVLDRLQDAGNVGTILRSAAAFGVTQVVALKGTAALWSPKVLRAGMGAHFGLNLVEGLTEDALASWDVPMLATSSHAEAAIDQTALPWPCAWVLGHEGQGVSAAITARCALMLRIPQPGGEESLNVGAAAAVCFYESARQRSAGAHRM